eukprot:TRINITY_DN105900_c0_g1_i1.p1 TRINITY_DN105900_c0_g1~~TRINITY_DN105900_c0_g1_i1.p1  ORF type:complete len:290 (+),score=44.53 TRINITY_DN105900_c0_g1_i1:44-871(+)
MASRSKPPRESAALMIRRGHEMIYVYNTTLAERYLLEPQEPKPHAPVQTDDSLIFALYKGSLEILSRGQQRSFTGLGQAVSNSRELLTKDTQKRLRGLHEAFGFARHLGDFTLFEFLSNLEQEVAEMQQLEKQGHTQKDSKDVIEKASKAVQHQPKHLHATSHAATMSDVGCQFVTEEADAEVQVDTETVAKEVQACDYQIKQDVALMDTEPEIVDSWQRRVAAHGERYPGGTLPSELRSLDAYKRLRHSMLTSLERLQYNESKRCLKCGAMPNT